MQRLLDAFAFSASDLNNFLACEHLVALELKRLNGEIPAPEADAGRETIFKKGREHEAAFLAKLQQEGRSIIELAPGWDSPEAVQARTLEAMRQGPDIIYQASFWEGAWRGSADFLMRVEKPSALGDYSYEPLDTKLSRSAKPSHVLQLCFYSELLARLQGVAPEQVHVALGNGDIEAYRLSDFGSYFRYLQARFQDWFDAGTPETVAYPVEYCGLCPWSSRCEAEWQEKDHLSLVANIRRSHIQRLEDAGITTVTALAAATARPRGISPSTFETLREQAALQLHHRTTGEHRYTLLAPQANRGFALLPAASEGDVFFDMEGYPYMSGGLEYLFGAVHLEAGAWVFKAFWAHDRAAERRAFEAFIDFVMAKRAAHPDMHVYHYAAYEETALKRLASQHGSREDELDTLLREGVLVDLFKVVRQGLRVSQPSYSIKKLEAFYMQARAAEVKNAGDSIVAYERWLETREEQILVEIGQYNEEDCVSTRLLRDWLHTLRTELETVHGEPLTWPESEAKELTDEQIAAHEADEALRARLEAGLPEDLDSATPEERAMRLLADVLDYHRREARPSWWSFFHRCGMTTDELVDDNEAIGRLVPEGTAPVRMEKKSAVWRFRFESQEHKVRVGSKLVDPATQKKTGEVVNIDSDAGWVEIKRGPSLAEAPMPASLFPHEHYSAHVQQQALRRLAQSVLATGIHGPGANRALRDLLLSASPRIAGLPAGTPLQGEVLELEHVQHLACHLDESVLVLQGPPGAGKTYTGARMIVALLAQGKRVGVGATSHKAIHNLLAEVERAAVEMNVHFQGLKKCTGDAPETQFDSPHGMIVSADKAEFTDPAVQLVAGTAWLFARDSMDDTLDVLVLDEAGQIGLADALAMGMSARNLILLGDPQQLPQVAQGDHPRGSGRSVLEHMLDGAYTIPPERGLFLDRTWRMHPQVTEFISHLAYEGRLRSAPGCETQGIDLESFGPAGLRYVPVQHRGNTQVSVEEAAAVREVVDRLLDAPYTDKRGETQPLGVEDILVVAPYNMQVDALRNAVPEGVKVGTVDKFQGQEAPVVIFSMATSSGDDLPRNMEFLFNRNRLNVAVSRAKCLAVLVACPDLLDVQCRTIEQMQLVNSLCRFVEMSRAQHGKPEQLMSEVNAHALD